MEKWQKWEEYQERCKGNSLKVTNVKKELSLGINHDFTTKLNYVCKPLPKLLWKIYSGCTYFPWLSLTTNIMKISKNFNLNVGNSPKIDGLSDE